MRTSPICKKNLLAILNEHSCYQQLFLPSPSFCSWERLTKSSENLGYGTPGFHAATFQYPASYIKDHGTQITLPSVALSGVEWQPLKSARCITLLQPGANLVAHAGAPWARTQERVPHHTHRVKPGHSHIAQRCTWKHVPKTPAGHQLWNISRSSFWKCCCFSK